MSANGLPWKMGILAGIIMAVVACFYFFIGKSESHNSSMKETTESASILSLNKYNDSKVKGSSVVSAVMYESNSNIGVIVDNGKTRTNYGNIISKETGLSEACGYASYKGTSSTNTNKSINYITNKTSKEFINTSSNFTSHHICDSGKNVIGLYFEILK